MSKFATKLKASNDEQMRLASDLSIDDILNIIELTPAPTHSMSFRTSASWKSRTSVAPRQNSNSSSFDESATSSATSSQSAALNEHRLKVLESNFNQIAISYHLDDKLLQTNIDKYREKYLKTMKYINLLFDDLDKSVNRVVYELNELTSSSKLSTNFLNESEDLMIGEELEMVNKSFESNHQSSLSTQSKKMLQEHMNFINKDVKMLRKHFSSIIGISGLISSLKQDAHLGELVKICISYVRELRKSNTITANKQEQQQVGSVNARNSIFTRSMSVSHNQIRHKEKIPKLKLNKLMSFNSKSIDEDQNDLKTYDMKKPRLSLASTSFTILTPSNLAPENETKTSAAIVQHEEPKANILANSTNDGKERVAETTTSLKLRKQFSSDLGLKLRLDEENKELNQNLPIAEKANDLVPCSLGVELTSSMCSSKQVLASPSSPSPSPSLLSKENLEQIKTMLCELPRLACQDSYRYLRIALSAIIFVVAIFMFIMSLFKENDFLDNVSHLIHNNIELKNPHNSARPI